jgi:hypothetical protein
MSHNLTRTFHPWLPPGTAEGRARASRPVTLGRGARLIQVQLERGGSQVPAQAGPGGTS